jgi:RNA-directed DNA polymerase
MRQKNQVELNLDTGAKGEALRAGDRSSCGESLSRTLGGHRPLMEAVVESENLNKALARVKHQ